MAEDGIQELRWGIVGCGWISSWFVTDILLDRPGASVRHILQAVGSSSLEKAGTFAAKNAPSTSPTLYASYEGVYADPKVDIVYIGTPHSLHLKNSLDAINAGKNVLCEKPMSINGKETELIIAAARSKGVYVMEGVWTRFMPLTSTLQKLLHVDRAIGSISRVFVDFSLDMPVSSLPPSSRTADPALGAGALLDIGIYPLTWAAIILDQHPDNDSAQPAQIASNMVFSGGIDEITSVILHYPSLSCQAILTASMRCKSPVECCRIEGSNGVIIVGGKSAPNPEFIMVKEKGKEERRIDGQKVGRGFYFEADQIAQDLKEGKLESDIMPLDETLRMMRLMDQIRKVNGLNYPQDQN